MAMIPDVPVNKMSPPTEVEDWVAELERLQQDPELQEESVQREIQAHLNDARTWLYWDLHGRVVERDEELFSVLEEVGAFTREPGDPPPEDCR